MNHLKSERHICWRHKLALLQRMSVNGNMVWNLAILISFLQSHQGSVDLSAEIIRSRTVHIQTKNRIAILYKHTIERLHCI
jgi:hypothetical protein